MSQHVDGALGTENVGFLEELYTQYLRDPSTVPAEYRTYFASLDASGDKPKLGPSFKPRSFFATRCRTASARTVGQSGWRPGGTARAPSKFRPLELPSRRTSLPRRPRPPSSRRLPQNRCAQRRCPTLRPPRAIRPLRWSKRRRWKTGRSPRGRSDCSPVGSLRPVSAARDAGHRHSPGSRRSAGSGIPRARSHDRQDRSPRHAAPADGGARSEVLPPHGRGHGSPVFQPDDSTGPRRSRCERSSIGSAIPTVDRSASSFMHMHDLEPKNWLQERMEGTENRLEISVAEQRRILTLLTDSVILEEFIQRKYLGAKSFSLEGSESLIPLLALTIERAAEHGSRRGSRLAWPIAAASTCSRTSWARARATSSASSRIWTRSYTAGAAT